MERLRRRKRDRTGDSPYSSSVTHRIKIGYKDRSGVPKKLPGFLIMADTLSAKDTIVADMGCMKRLGFGEESITKAWRLARIQEGHGLLPTELHFVIRSNADRIDGRWVYSGLYAEEMQCYNKAGLFCRSDGVSAVRKNEGGGCSPLPCVPAGVEGKPDAECCPFSVSHKCKTFSRLILDLIYREPATGKWMPLHPTLGEQARYAFDTTSEYNPIRILGELDRAASRTGGRIANLPGTLSYHVRPVRTGRDEEGAHSVGIVGQIGFMLSQSAIEARENEIWNRQIEERRLQLLPRGLRDQKDPSSELELPASVGRIEAQAVENHFAVADQDEGIDPRAQCAAVVAQIQEQDQVGQLAFELTELFHVDSWEDVPDDRLGEFLSVARQIATHTKEEGT